MSDTTPSIPAQSADVQEVAREVLLDRLLREALEALCKAQIQRMLSTPHGKAQLNRSTQSFLRALLADIFQPQAIPVSQQGDSNVKEQASE